MAHKFTKKGGGGKARTDEEAGGPARTSRDLSRSRIAGTCEAEDEAAGTSREDTRSRIAANTGAFKTPEGRAVQRKPGPRSRTSSASSCEGSVRDGHEPCPSTSGRVTPITGRKRKAEPSSPPLRGAKGHPPTVPDPPSLTRAEVRETLEGALYEGKECDADRVVNEVRRNLEALEQFRIEPTYREGDGVPFGRVGLAREGFQKVGEAVDYLYGLALNTGVGEKEAQVCRLHKEVDKLRGEVNRLKEEVRSLRAGVSSAGGAPPARGADKPKGGVPRPPLPPKGAGGPGQQARKKKRGGGTSRSVSRPRPPPLGEAEYPPLPQPGKEWTKVERRKRRKAGRPPEGAPPPAAKPPPTGARRAAPPTKAEQTKQRRRRAAPQTAAVTITAIGERTYAEIMKEARERVSLAEIGIKGMTLKRARNGGYLLEVPGVDGPDMADRLARELDEVLSGNAVVARPVKSAELRVTGLDESVSLEEVERALCAAGECARSSLRMGNIRRAANGLGAVWVRCPLAAALRLEKAGRLDVGWTHAVVRLLEDRPLQCYKCLNWGHTAAACKGRIDRSGRCFNCGGVDHVARDCVARSRCPVCDAAGETADHRMGGPACATLKKRVAKKSGVPPPVKEKGGKKVGKVGGKGGGSAPRPPAAAKARPVEPSRPPGESRPPAAVKACPVIPPREPSPAPKGMEVSPSPGPGEEPLTQYRSQSPHFGDSMAPSLERAVGGVVDLSDDDDPTQVSPTLHLDEWADTP